MKTATVHRTRASSTKSKHARKPAPVKKVDITKLSNAELDALDETVFVASLTPKLRRLYILTGKLKGAFR